jgi:hypothetical protein
MAENVKRRVAAARMAVAFVAAGTIAGATAWAQAGPPPTADSSALNAYLKLKLDSSNIKNGSLLFADFIKGEVASGKQFKKLDSSVDSFKKAVKTRFSSIKGEIGDIKSQIGDIKSQLGSYIKGEAADARYIKLSDAVIRGDGSVFTDTASLGATSQERVFSIAGLVDVDAVNGPSPHMLIANTSGGTLTHSDCGANSPAGTIAPGGTLMCDVGTDTTTMQLFTGGATPIVATLSFSSFTPPSGGQNTQFVSQILIGL